ncbi:hypothetical protein MBLNU459_g3781t1 [Dothideomycetes sp. NU459]
MAAFEPFTLVEEAESPRLFDTFQRVTSAPSADHDIQYLAVLRKQFPEYVVTSVPTSNCNLLAFARAGKATATLDTQTDAIARWRGWSPALRSGELGFLSENVFFAKYHYQWSSEHFIVYAVGNVQYILKELKDDETQFSHSAVTDSLIATAGTWLSADREVIWVFDNAWSRSKDLFKQVEKAEWDNVILDEDMKKALTSVSEKFFESKDVYEDLGVPWKRGIIFYGPAGNGKTISIKALMHTLMRLKSPIPTLYVKAAPQTWQIRNVFSFARRMTPCLLVFEDIDTVVTANTRSYFFNEVDGLENNDGILMVASTNHLDRLDPGISKRPSRFDRKYLFPLPSEHERTLYCEFWRQKLRNKSSSVEFPSKLCAAIASITDGFSFAYLQEAFVAALLVIARHEVAERPTASARDGLDDYELWVVIKEQVRMLREDMDGQAVSHTPDAPVAPVARCSGPDMAENGDDDRDEDDVDDQRTMTKPQWLPGRFRAVATEGPEPVLNATKWPYINSAAREWK